LGATGRTYQGLHAGTRMAVTSVHEFADDFIRALGGGVAGAWRERWWTLDLLLVHGVEALSETERAQDEFFHLFEALKRRGARVLLVADRPPAAISGIDDRLRSRFEGGLVLELDGGTPGGDLILEDERLSIAETILVPGLSSAGEAPGRATAPGGATASGGATADADVPAAGSASPSGASTDPRPASAVTATAEAAPTRGTGPDGPPERAERTGTAARAAAVTTAGTAPAEPAPSPVAPRKGGTW